jgi:hypothetical protein
VLPAATAGPAKQSDLHPRGNTQGPMQKNFLAEKKLLENITMEECSG